MGRIISMVGLVFGRLTVVSRAGSDVAGNVTYNCSCHCGRVTVVSGYSLRRGTTASCGCYHSEVCTRHGGCGTPTYKVWSSIKERCLHPKCSKYPNYGGRGIKVCDRWLKFENFLADMGERPDGMTIDRINNDGDYEPGNCRWATPVEQASNTRATRFTMLGGERVTFSEAARRLGMSRSGFGSRVSRGLYVEVK